LHRQVGGLLALEDTIDVASGLPVRGAKRLRCQPSPRGGWPSLEARINLDERVEAIEAKLRADEAGKPDRLQ
jgi:hypothetical protein